MSLWKRFTRFVKSIFGGAIDAAESPKLILEQNIRELNDQVPAMNDNIAEVMAHMKRTEDALNESTRKVEEYTSKIQAAINNDREDIARKFAMRLESEKQNVERITRNLEHAEEAYEKALEVKKAFMREKERKIQQAKDAIRANEQAEWQSEIAATMEQFEIGDIDQTHQEMLSRLNDATAKSEARLDMALDSVDVEAMQIEEDAEELRAQEIVDQFKAGMNPPQQLPEEAESLQGASIDLPGEEAVAESEAAPVPEKTIGRQHS